MSKPLYHITRFTHSQSAHKTGLQIESYTSLNFPEIHKTEFSHTEAIRVSPILYAYQPFPYAYHTRFARTRFCLEAISYAYQPRYTRITRIIFLFQNFHTRMSILIRSSYANHRHRVFGTGQLRIIRV